jgi:hypothetical protein
MGNHPLPSQPKLDDIKSWLTYEGINSLFSLFVGIETWALRRDGKISLC